MFQKRLKAFEISLYREAIRSVFVEDACKLDRSSEALKLARWNKKWRLRNCRSRSAPKNVCNFPKNFAKFQRLIRNNARLYLNTNRCERWKRGARSDRKRWVRRWIRRWLRFGEVSRRSLDRIWKDKIFRLGERKERNDFSLASAA